MTSMTARQPALVPELMIEVGPGELIDKITILDIKYERITDPEKRAHVAHERRVLMATRDACLPADSRLETLTGQLREVNEALWDIEDKLRRHEAAHDFGADFIALARAVYHQNDRRAALKRDINLLLNASIVEQKSYVDYQKSA